MQITRLSLQNFRSYVRLELDLPPGVTLLHGDNAQGKTNLLESIYYLATTRSPYAGHDSQLINWDSDQDQLPLVVGRITADLRTERGPLHLEMRLIKEQNGRIGSFRREALVNRRKVRLMDLLTNLRVVQFLPQDIQVLTGSPAGRRRYLNVALCQTDGHYCRTLATYDKILEQRNATLRRIAEEGRGEDLLPVYTDQLVTLGSEIVVRRARFIADLARDAERIHYEELTDGREIIKLGYLPRLDKNGNGSPNGDEPAKVVEQTSLLAESAVGAVAHQLRQRLSAGSVREVALGRTDAGPHLDDWRLWVNGRALDAYGSRGQQRTAMLALKLAEIEWMTRVTGEAPILLLDEVVAELDDQRRELLLAYVQRGAQALLTATDLDMFPRAFLEKATTMRVSSGQITPATNLPATDR